MFYLRDLTIRLAQGMEGLPQTLRDRHAAMIHARQNSDGGYRGRSEESDLYYTAFALRSLAIMGELHGERAALAAEFLRHQLTGRASIIDFLSLMYGAFLVETAAGEHVFRDADAGWPDAVAATLESLRREDGGYAKSAEGSASSTYHSFLVVLCYQLLEREIPDPDGIERFLRARQDPEGGFLEIRVGKRAGTNPTAAAIGTLEILDRLDPETRELTIDFLLDMQTDEGGLRANTRIPIPDLLSTFTGLWTLERLGALQEADCPAARRFARAMEVESGGFLGAALDPEPDVEYTFYGLGTLALLGVDERTPGADNTD